VFTLQTLPAEPDAPRPEVAESSGFSLRAGLAAMSGGGQSGTRERGFLFVGILGRFSP